MTDGRSRGRLHRILVVDDDPETLRLARVWFRGRPFEILGALTGEEGVRATQLHKPDVILLDLKLPDRDGISVARDLKADPFTRSIPIILLTACKDVESKVQAFQAGAEDYVTKPFSFEEIDARIESTLRRRDDRLAMEARIRTLELDNVDLEHSLSIDERTGLCNFRAFQRRLEEEWQRAARYATPLSLVLLDIDLFKIVNDSHGHQAGDRVLRQFATLVLGSARANDVAARYGGEEFAVILPHTEGDMAVHVAERIRSATEETVFLEDEAPTRITVSCGVATYHSTGGRIDSVEALVRAADVALYRAKDEGRNRVVLNTAGAVAGFVASREELGAKRRRSEG